MPSMKRVTNRIFSMTLNNPLVCSSFSISFNTSLLENEECPMKERAKKLVKVITPMPPIWIRNMMMICPVCVKVVATSTVVSPVTQTDVVDMNKASTK